MSVSEAAARLRAAGVEQPWREARRLHEFAGGEAAAFAAAVARREAREPFALITGRRGFWTLELDVSGDTLVPRPESETLVEAALAAFPERGRVQRILDLGTGTGCLLLACLAEFPAAFGVGVDVWPAACGLARWNAASCGVAGRSAFVAGDWMAAIGGRFELVLCNPPYVASGEMAGLMPELGWEPARALDGGAGGLEAYRQVLAGLRPRLGPGGVAILELGAGQLGPVREIAAGCGLVPAGVRDDLSGTERALLLQ